MRTLFFLALTIAAGCGTVQPDAPDGGPQNQDPDDPDASPPPPPPMPDAPPPPPPDAPEPTACTGPGDCAPGQACDLTDGMCVDARLMLDPTGFFADPTGQWWTIQSGPRLAGTVSAPDGTSVRAYVGGQQVGPAATITGDRWTIDLPAGTIATAGTNVIVRLVGAHMVEAAQTIVFDPDPAAVAVPTAAGVRDERDDDISFATGVPRHDHAGATVRLGAAGCPDIYKHAYLMDPGSPVYGSEVAPNPLRWLVDVLDVATPGNRVQYRVRIQGGATVRDWTLAPTGSTPSPGTLRHAIDMLRSGPDAIAALGTTDGAFEIDVKVTDWASRVTTDTWCWTHHPLAAPLQITQLGAAPGGLTSYSLITNSPVSRLLDPSAAPTPVVQGVITQRTAEPVRLEVTLTAPSGGTYSLLPVSDTVDMGTAPVNIDCGTRCATHDPDCLPHPVTTPECQTNAPPDASDTVRSGTLNSGAWSVRIVDDAGAAIACDTTSALVARCTIPARAEGAPPRTYRVVGSVRDLANLRPFGAGTYGEYTLTGLTYTGKPHTTAVRCADLNAATAGSLIIVTCVSQRRYGLLEALDTPQVTFGPMALRPRTSPAAGIAYTVPPATTASLLFPTISWNGGNDDLPGPH